MAYVPPHLRSRQSVTPAASADSRETAKGRPLGLSRFYSREDISKYVGCWASQLSTLATPSSSPESLKAILLHEGEHPEWKSARKLLCKTNIEALSGFDVADDSLVTTSYPLFINMPFFAPGARSQYEFGGWWRISKVQFLQPNSPELFDLFEKKFNTQKQRTKEAWLASLNRLWAVVTLEKDGTKKDDPLSVDENTTVELQLIESRMNDTPIEENINAISTSSAVSTMTI